MDLQLVTSRYQKADIFTKGLAGELWGPALDLLGIVNGYVVTRTTNTGLKMQENFDESLRPSYAEAKPVSVPTQDNPKPKANVKKRYKKKAPRILPYKKAPED